MHKSDQESVDESDEGPAARSTRTRSKSPVDKASAKRKVAPTASSLRSCRSRRSLRSIRSRRSHPTLSPLASYAPAARFILSRRSLRSLHVPTPHSVHSAGTSFHGYFVGTVYVSSGSEPAWHKGMICFANFCILASQISVILLRKFWSYCFANFGHIASQILVTLLRKFW